MSKFKKNFGIQKEDEEQEVALGTGLLNNVSKSLVTEKIDETIYIDMDRIRSNKKNEYSIGDLEDLADSIRLGNGIWQNLIVKPMDDAGFYELTTGERRLRAAKILRDRGEYPQEFHNKVPCSIKDPNDIDLPLSPENKEVFSILLTNKYRNKTDGDTLMEIRRWKEIFTELRKNGIETLTMKPEGKKEVEVEGNVTELQIKGVRTRELVANKMDISTGQVSRFENIEKKGSQAVIESLMNNKIDLPTAEKIAHMPKEEQTAFMEENGEHITLDAVQRYSQAKEKKVTVSSEELQDDLERIKEMPQDVELTEKEYKCYKKCIAQLIKIFG